MRKINSKKDEAKKRKRNQLIVGVILIGVMLVSTFGILSNSFGKNENLEEEKINYNGQEFYFANNLWYTELGNSQFAFKTNPNESINIEEEINYLNSYSNYPLYIYSENYEPKTEIYRNFYYVVERIQDACPDLDNLGYLNCQEEWPAKSCENKIIIVLEGDENKITQKENCLIIAGEKESLTKLTDSALLKIIGLQ